MPSGFFILSNPQNLYHLHPISVHTPLSFALLNAEVSSSGVAVSNDRVCSIGIQWPNHPPLSSSTLAILSLSISTQMHFVFFFFFFCHEHSELYFRTSNHLDLFFSYTNEGGSALFFFYFSIFYFFFHSSKVGFVPRQIEIELSQKELFLFFFISSTLSAPFVSQFFFFFSFFHYSSFILYCCHDTKSDGKLYAVQL